MRRRDILKLFAFWPFCGQPASPTTAVAKMTYPAVLAPTRLLTPTQTGGYLDVYRLAFAAGIINVEEVRFLEGIQ